MRLNRTNKLVLLFLGFYKKTISQLLIIIFGRGCRYSPSCSEYSFLAIEKHGLLSGGKLSIKRVLSCHPLARRSYLDPVPDRI